MWDSFLIFLSKNPFMVSSLPLVLSAIFLYFGRKSSKYKILGATLLIVGIGIGSVLHFRWDSFAIHFWKIQVQRASCNDKILFVGDSITCEGSRPRGFITKIQAILPVDVRNLCHKGATTAEIGDLVDLYKVDFNPVTIFAQSGINDLLNGKTQKQISESQQYLFSKLSNKFPNSRVVFLPVHPLKIENNIIATISAHLPTDFKPWWEDTGSFARDFLLDDGVHLSAKAHSLLAKAITNNIISKNS
jgi:hypothetical protein